jgi:two-component system phosphate regulon sensor histidine kinase PhoR
MSRKRLLWQIFPSYLLIIVLSMAAVTWYASFSFRRFYIQRTTVALKDRAELIKVFLPLTTVSNSARAMTDSLCKKLGAAAQMRITIILPDGIVIADSDEDPAKMNNHASRPEVATALAGKEGTATRHSFTMDQEMVYVAEPLYSGGQIAGVLRTALPINIIDHLLHSLQGRIVFAMLALILIAAIMSLLLARHLARPLEEIKRAAQRYSMGDFSTKLPVPNVEEMASVAGTMNEMATQMDLRIKTITRQRNEQEAILSSMVEGVIAIDQAEKVFNLNRAAARLLGVTPEQALNKKIQEVIRNSDLQKLAARILQSAVPLQAEIKLTPLPNQPEMEIEVHATPLHDLNQQTIGALILLHDITRLKKLETVRRDFVANVSHELRTPLTAIKGFVETLQDGGLADPVKAQEFLQIIGRQADRLNAIVEDLLQISRLEKDENQELKTEKTNFYSLLSAALQTCRQQASEKHIALQMDCPNDLSAVCDAALMERALLNLLDNAIKYSPEGSAINLKANKNPAETFISVQDQGSGIPTEHLPRLFERFYRADKARSREQGGTGLGLAIVKHIMQRHGGTVTVESVVGRGSIFSLHLPG